MFDDMAWTDDHSSHHDRGGNGGQPDWEMELLRMRYTEGSGHQGNAMPGGVGSQEPMELSPDPFYLASSANTSATSSSSAMATNALNLGHQTQHHQPTMTTSASCPSFTSLYDIDGDDLLRDIPDGEPLGGGPLPGSTPFSNYFAMGQQANTGGYDYVLQLQQQYQNNNLRQYPHQMAMPNDAHMAVLQQSRRQLHMSASFTSLSSMETEYRRHLASKRKKAVNERWNKAQRHKSFDSTTTSVGTSPSPAASMEFSTFDSASTFESTPETTPFLEEIPVPRRPTDADMIGFSIDDFPTTFTSDSSWPMPPPLSLAGDASGAFDAFGDSSASLLNQQPQMFPSHAPVSSHSHPHGTNSSSSTDMDQLLLSDQERANVSSLLDAIRDFDSPTATIDEDKIETQATTSVREKKKSSPVLTGKPRSGSTHQRHTKSPHLRGIARGDSGGRRKAASTAAAVSGTPATPVAAAPVAVPLPPSLPVEEEQPSLPSMRDRIQRVLERTSSTTMLSKEEQVYLNEAPQFAPEKAVETAGSLWLLLHGSRCIESNCAVSGCDVMRRVAKHCRGCDAPLGKCRDPCNDAKAMLFHHATCSSQQSKDIPTDQDPSASSSSSSCPLCSKVQEIDRNHNAMKTRPPLSPQLKPHMSPLMMPPPSMMAMPPLLLAPQPPLFLSPALKPAGSGNGGGGSKHIAIQPNPMPTASNPMGLMGSFPHFGCSLALYLEQTSPPFRVEVKTRVEKRVTTAAGQDLIQHMQKKTRLRSLEDLRSEARTIVLGEMERELHLHMQAVNWATASSSSTSPDTSSSNTNPASQGESPGLPSYLLSVAAAGFAAFYTQQATIQAAMAGVGSPFGVVPQGSPPVSMGMARPLSRQSSAGSIATSSGGSTLPLAPRKPTASTASTTSIHQSPALSPKEPVPSSDVSTEAALTV